jgi:hypothetical protein
MQELFSAQTDRLAAILTFGQLATTSRLHLHIL